MQQEPQRSSPSRLRDVDALRALSAGGVLVYHCWLYSAPSGARLAYHGAEHLLEALRFGRQFFFVLSGFLLYRAFAHALANGMPRPSTGTYLTGRFLRIAPAYWVALFLVAIVLGIARTDIATLETGSLLQRPWTLLADALLLQDFFPSTVLTGIGPSWSLAVEVQFYLALPLLAAMAFAVGRRSGGAFRGLVAPGLVMIGIGTATKTAVAVSVGAGVIDKICWSGTPYGLAMLSMPFNAEQFGAGMLLAGLHAARCKGIGTTADTRRALATAGALCLPVICVMLLGVPGGQQYVDVVLAALAALVIHKVMLAERDPRWMVPVRRFLSLPGLAWVGTLSYGIFLYNEPALLLLRRAGLTGEGWLSFPVNLATVLAVAVALAWLSHALVESPCLALKARLGRRGRASRTQVAGAVAQAGTART